MEVTLEQLAAALTTALTEVLDPEEFDIALGVTSVTRELDVAADDWTLHLEGWPETIGWLAIDDEPDDPSHYDSARRAVMPELVEQALAGADREVGGTLARALAASNDPFTRAFVATLETMN